MKEKLLSFFLYLSMTLIVIGISHTAINVNKYLEVNTRKAQLEIEKLKYELELYKEQS